MDARLLSVFAVLASSPSPPDDGTQPAAGGPEELEGAPGGRQLSPADLRKGEVKVAARCLQLLRGYATPLEADLAALAGDAGAGAEERATWARLERAYRGARGAADCSGGGARSASASAGSEGSSGGAGAPLGLGAGVKLCIGLRAAKKMVLVDAVAELDRDEELV